MWHAQGLLPNAVPAWALSAVALWPPACCIDPCSAAHPPCRDPALSTTRHADLAVAAAACALQLGRQQQHAADGAAAPLGCAGLLLMARCHQVAAHAYLRAGNVTEAFVHSQEALRLTTSLYAAAPGSSSSTSAGSGGSGSGGHVTGGAGNQGGGRPGPAPTAASVPSAAQEASAVVAGGSSALLADYAAMAVAAGAGDEEHGGPETAGATPEGGAGAGATPHGAAQSRAARAVQASGLAWAVAHHHLAALYQSACVFEAAGCAEDALCIGRECSRVAAGLGVAGVQLLAGCLLADVSTRRGDHKAAAAGLEAAARHLPPAGESAVCAGGGGSSFALSPPLPHACVRAWELNMQLVLCQGP